MTMHSRDPDQKLGIPREPEECNQVANAVLAECPNPERCVIGLSAQLCQACLEQLDEKFKQALFQMIENPSDEKNQTGSGARTPDGTRFSRHFFFLHQLSNTGPIAYATILLILSILPAIRTR
jgi:hypothetical protein